MSDQSVDNRTADEVAVRPSVSVSLEAEQGSGLQTEGVAKVVERDARRCYRLALQKDRALEGTAIYEVIVTSNGRVGGVEQTSTTAPSQRFEECVERVLHGLRFDVPEGRKALVRRIYVRLEVRRDIYDPHQSPLQGEPKDES